MDDTPHQPNPSHSKTSLPTFARTLPVEIAALPASTRTSFTRVDNTRPGTAVGDHSNDDPAVSGPGDDDNGRGGDGARSAPPLEDGLEEGETGAVVPQVPQTLVQFLLVSGRRRSMAFDPETTVGRVKELVWNTWPNGTSSFPSRFLPHPRTHAHAGAPLPYGPTKCAAATGLDSVLYSFHSFIFLFKFIFINDDDRTLPILVEVWTFLSPDLTDDRVTTTTDWQDEHPPTPSHLRVLYLGRVLQDDETLTRTCVV